jgi:hypothetical protein
MKVTNLIVAFYRRALLHDCKALLDPQVLRGKPVVNSDQCNSVVRNANHFIIRQGKQIKSTPQLKILGQQLALL